MPSKVECTLSRAEIYSLANEVRGRFHDSSSISKSVHPKIQRDVLGMLYTAIRSLNGRIRLYSGRSDCMIVKEDKTFKINLTPGIQGFSNFHRDNFTLAYHIGHYYLHLDLECEGQVVFDRESEDRKTSIQAAWFASELLMPSDEVRRLVAEKHFDERRLSLCFGVSEAMAIVKLSVLGLKV